MGAGERVVQSMALWWRRRRLLRGVTGGKTSGFIHSFVMEFTKYYLIGTVIETKSIR